MSADRQQRIKMARILRALNLAAAALELLAGAVELADGPAVAGLLLMFAMTMMLACAVLQTLKIRRIRQDGRRLTPPMRQGVFIQPEIVRPAAFEPPSQATILQRKLERDIKAALGGLSMAEFKAEMTRLAHCPHPGAVPVDLLVTGERVGWLCVVPSCDAMLPVGWPGPLA